MTVTIDIPEDIGTRLRSKAQASGVPLPQLVRDILIEQVVDIEDLLIAEERLKDPQPP